MAGSALVGRCPKLAARWTWSSGESGFKLKVVHRNAGENHVYPRGLITIPSVPGSCELVSSCSKILQVMSFYQHMEFSWCSGFPYVVIVWVFRTEHRIEISSYNDVSGVVKQLEFSSYVWSFLNDLKLLPTNLHDSSLLIPVLIKVSPTLHF